MRGRSKGGVEMMRRWVAECRKHLKTLQKSKEREKVRDKSEG